MSFHVQKDLFKATRDWWFGLFWLMIYQTIMSQIELFNLLLGIIIIIKQNYYC